MAQESPAACLVQLPMIEFISQKQMEAMFNLVP